MTAARHSSSPVLHFHLDVSQLPVWANGGGPSVVVIAIGGPILASRHGTGSQRLGRTSWSVSRILFPAATVRGGDHPSGHTVAGCLERPTRRLGRAALKHLRSRTVVRPFDLASGGVYLATPVTRHAGALLPHRFTLTTARVAVCFLWHCPASHLGLPLTITLLCEVRTFLDWPCMCRPRSPGQLVRANTVLVGECAGQQTCRQRIDASHSGHPYRLQVKSEGGAPADADGGFDTKHVDAGDWAAIAADVNDFGGALLPRLLTTTEARRLRKLYGKDELFRATIDMKPRRYGSGHIAISRLPTPTHRGAQAGAVSAAVADRPGFVGQAGP